MKKTLKNKQVQYRAMKRLIVKFGEVLFGLKRLENKCKRMAATYKHESIALIKL